MKLADASGNSLEAVYFGQAVEFQTYVQKKDTISVTYYPEINVYQGRETLQAVIRNYM